MEEEKKRKDGREEGGKHERRFSAGETGAVRGTDRTTDGLGGRKDVWVYMRVRSRLTTTIRTTRSFDSLDGMRHGKEYLVSKSLGASKQT